MEVEWYYSDLEGSQTGPVDRDGLKVEFNTGVLNTESFLWREGLADWTILKELAELRDIYIPPPAPPARPKTRLSVAPPRPPPRAGANQSASLAIADVTKTSIDATKVETAFNAYLVEKEFPSSTHELVKLKVNLQMKKCLTTASYPDSIKNPKALLEGFLCQATKGQLAKLRYISLRPGELLFFKEQSAAKEAGSIALDTNTIITLDLDEKARPAPTGYPFTFTIDVQEKKKRKKHTIHVETEVSRDLWMTSLQVSRYGALPADRSISTDHVCFEMTYDMMMGIRTTTGRQQSMQLAAIASEKDFAEITAIAFPKQGSKDTPPHKMKDFGFKDYCPNIFRRIRARFGIDPAQYLLDVCGNFNYLEFVSNSKSGEFFFHSHDRKYMIKTVSHNECRCLFTHMSHYYRHIMSNPDSTLNKFFGMHKVKPSSGQPFYFLIMGSVFPSTLKMHRTFDLKGSTRNRSVKASARGKDGTVYKDNDFVEQNVKVVLGNEMADKLKKQIRKDLLLLETLKIIDYSVLLGMHYIHGFDPSSTYTGSKPANGLGAPGPSSFTNISEPDRCASSGTLAKLTETVESTDALSPLSDNSEDDQPEDIATSKMSVAKNGQQTAEFKKQLHSLLDTDGLHLLQLLEAMPEAELLGVSQGEFVSKAKNNPLAPFLYQAFQSQVQGGDRGNRGKSDFRQHQPTRRISMRPVDKGFHASLPTPAMPFDSIPSPRHAEATAAQLERSIFAKYQGGIKGQDQDGHEVIFFVGIIDTLIEYNLKKKMEKNYKTTVKGLDPASFSIAEPPMYAERMVKFMEEKIR